MEFIAEMRGEDGLTIVGKAAEDGEELFTCEGCGDKVKQVFYSLDEVVLCQPCFDLCVNEGEAV